MVVQSISKLNASRVTLYFLLVIIFFFTFFLSAGMDFFQTVSLHLGVNSPRLRHYYRSRKL